MSFDKVHMRSKIGAWILEDQCSLAGSAIKALPPGSPILLIEDFPWLSAFPHHWQKLVMLIAAQRHLAQELRRRGFKVVQHVLCSDPIDALNRFALDHRLDELRVMEPADDSRGKWVRQLGLSCRLAVTDNNLFLTSESDFAAFAEGRKQLVMETFYRQMRKKLGILVDSRGTPVGGRWNYDDENRVGKIPPQMSMPPDYRHEIDATTRKAFLDVRQCFAGRYFGQMPETPDEAFIWPVTAEQATRQFEDFIQSRLRHFGPYEDAMTVRSPSVFHSQLSPAMNCGLLHPRTMVNRLKEIGWSAEKNGGIPLNSLEGFTRQIIGWREFMRGVYAREMHRTGAVSYLDRNELDAARPLPEFYWTGRTEMACVRESLKPVLKYGYSHHITRLMVLGNFALLHGINPKSVNEWFTYAYADGYEWVTTPNVVGMALYADGGIVATKPYCAGGAYINRMSDHCAQCVYDPGAADGPKACPFTRAYWPFIARHAQRLASNPRMSLILKGLNRIGAAEIRRREEESARWLMSLPIYSPGGAQAD